MLDQDPNDALPGVLVEEAFDALYGLMERPGHRVDRGERQPGIGRGQLTDLAPSPLRDLTFGQRHELDTRRHGRDARTSRTALRLGPRRSRAPCR